MGNRLKASKLGIELARQAARNKRWTQGMWADVAKVTWTTLKRFCDEGTVTRDSFIAICEAVEVDWKEVADELYNQSILKEAGTSPDIKISVDIGGGIEALTQQVRSKIKPDIERCCGTMKMLDMSQPIGLNDIYTNVNILEKITGCRVLKIPELMKDYDPENFDRFGLSRTTEKRVPGLEAVERYRKLLVLGKPGAGKTTFLKYISIQCISGEAYTELVPIFITLKQFAENEKQQNLLEFISQKFISFVEITLLLGYGKFIILLDGLDEVREEDSTRVIKEIKNFHDKYTNNKFIITCRIAARQNVLDIFEDFTPVEVADFDDEQIKTFVTNLFRVKGAADAPLRFMLHLQANKQIKELATNPLLLTLLCIEFEDSGDFPSDRAELYNRAIHTLLRKWDSKRGIVRDEVYKQLSIRYKENLLSEIAYKTFERKDYFFKQKEIQKYISDYIRNLPEAKTDPEALRVDSETILKSIEAQHGLLVERARGIYSFSHLTFQEHFAARYIADNSNQENALKTLAPYSSKKRWREVFLLTVEMLTNADNLLLLMKKYADTLLANDEKLQQILIMIHLKVCSEKGCGKPAFDRALYLDRILQQPFVLSRCIDQNLDENVNFYYERVDIHMKNHCLSYFLGFPDSYDFFSDYLYFAEEFRHALIFAGEDSYATLDLAQKILFTLAIQSLTLDKKSKLEIEAALIKTPLRNIMPIRKEEYYDKFEQWWLENGDTFTEQLRTIMIKYYNNSHGWRFTYSQEKLLRQYHDANKLLVECLNSNCYVSRDVRQHIEDTLLLPINSLPPIHPK